MSVDDVSSDEWFARYMIDAGFLVALVLTAIGVSWYLEGGEYLRDWTREPGAGFLVCMVLVPVLGIVTLCLVIYAGVRVFLRPHTFGHALVRLSLLVAHAFVFLVCADTISSTAGALAGSFGQLYPDVGSVQSWSAIEDRDFSGSEYDVREGSPDDSSSSPSQFGPGPMGPPNQGRGQRTP